MKWTKEEPTKSGYYWYKGDDSVAKICIIDADDPDDDMGYATTALFPGDISETYLTDLDGYWCGPLEPPQS